MKKNNKRRACEGMDEGNAGFVTLKLRPKEAEMLLGLMQRALISNSHENPDAKKLAKPIACKIPTANECADETVIHKPEEDTRQLVATTMAAPHKMIGLILSYIGDKIYSGTGTLIGRNTVLTASHVIYNRNMRAAAHKALFFPGVNGDSSCLVATCSASAIYFTDEYAKSGREDYGMIFLDKPIGDELGFIKLGLGSDLTGTDVMICGYQGDKIDKDKKYQQWASVGRIGRDDGNKLAYPLDSFASQSGGPVIRTENGVSNIIGVHIQGGENENYATKMTAERINQIYKWSTFDLTVTNMKVAGKSNKEILEAIKMFETSKRGEESWFSAITGTIKAIASVGTKVLSTAGAIASALDRESYQLIDNQKKPKYEDENEDDEEKPGKRRKKKPVESTEDEEEPNHQDKVEGYELIGGGGIGILG
ncbi:MAG: trypsin-like serine protease [Candidatus Pacebacteria bacterium]|nr:trypsin-like serine protease [Candidatus Paceibacterota bacterium]